MRETYFISGIYVEHVRPDGAIAANRPPILLVHGAGHGAWCWERWMEALPGLGWEAYALSLRNHPGSRAVFWEEFLRRLRVEDYVDDVSLVADHIGQPAIVVGHSMGGLVVQRFAARAFAAGRPLAGLVLLAAATPGALGPLRDAPLPVDRPYLPTPEQSRQRYFHTAPAEAVERAIARIGPESPSVMNDYSLTPGITIPAADVHCPTLAVTAERDGTAVPKDRRLADYYGGDFVFYPNTGHDVMLEANANSILKDILSWAERRLRH